MTRLLIALALATPVAAQQGADPGYRVGVVSEAVDVVTWLRPGPNGLSVDRVVQVGTMPSDNDGPHNVPVDTARSRMPQ